MVDPTPVSSTTYTVLVKVYACLEQTVDCATFYGNLYGKALVSSAVERVPFTHNWQLTLIIKVA